MTIVAAIEEARLQRVCGIAHQRFDDVAGEGVADPRAQLLPVRVVDQWSLYCTVEVSDGTANRFFFPDLDESQFVQHTNVVADVAERSIDLRGDFLRAGGSFGEDRQRLHPHRVVEGFDQNLLRRFIGLALPLCDLPPLPRHALPPLTSDELER